MRVAHALCSAAIVAGMVGCCGHDRCQTYSAEVPIYVDHCPTYTYVKDGVDEARLLADEKVVRGMDGVAVVRTKVDAAGQAAVTVTVHHDDDIAVREKLLGLGYHRRW